MAVHGWLICRCFHWRSTSSAACTTDKTIRRSCDDVRWTAAAAASGDCSSHLSDARRGRQTTSCSYWLPAQAVNRTWRSSHRHWCTERCIQYRQHRYYLRPDTASRLSTFNQCCVLRYLGWSSGTYCWHTAGLALQQLAVAHIRRWHHLHQVNTGKTLLSSTHALVDRRITITLDIARWNDDTDKIAF